MVITSLENERIKGYIKLSKKKYRDLTNTYIVEGDHLVREAYKAGIVKELIAIEGYDIVYDVPCVFVSVDVMKKISTMESFPSIMAVCNKRENDIIIGKKILLLDDIQDPGNLGTIIRSAVAFNISTIILSKNTVDLYNPKVLRSTQGMYCHVNILSMDSIDAINKIKEMDIPVYGTSVTNGVDVRSLDSSLKDSYCLIMGNEGNGVSQEVLSLCDKNLYISMNKEVESLNVAIACSILLYELGR